MSIVITGASGFIGSAVLRRLQEDGRSVVSVGRSVPEIAGVTHIEWDITETAPAEVRALARTATAVVHAAAVKGYCVDFGLSRAVNATGTRHVIHAILERIYRLSREVIELQQASSSMMGVIRRLLIGAMVALAVVLYLVFKKKGWM